MEIAGLVFPQPASGEAILLKPNALIIFHFA